MSVLVDTSVWVDHFKSRNDALVSLLVSDQALTHPMVVVELVQHPVNCFNNYRAADIGAGA